MSLLRRVSFLWVVLAIAPLCFAGGSGGESKACPVPEVGAPETLADAAKSYLALGYTDFPAVREMKPGELVFVATFFDALKLERQLLGAPAARPLSAGSGCYYACFDLEDSSQYCPPGQNFAWEATGPFYNCYIVGGGVCISSGCTVHISSCSGFAPNCGGGGGF